MKSFSPWLGHQVFLQVRNEEFLVTLHGRIIDESCGKVRFRLDERWDVDIYREMILSVEPDTVFSFAD